jgi:hypothetical protein
LELSELLTLPRGTSLAAVTKSTEWNGFVGKSVFRFQLGGYFQLSQFKNRNLVHDAGAPFIVGIYFAPDDGAIKRVTEFAVEEDANEKLTLPSIALPSGSISEYGSILMGLKKTHPDVCQETGAYRIATDGKFIHRSIETGRWTYFFRGAADDKHEPPYAVLYKSIG